MPSNRHICVVVTARPSYSRIRSVLLELKNRPDVQLSVIVAASALIPRYGRIVEQMQVDGLEVVATASTLVDGNTPIAMTKTVGLGVLDLSTLFEQLHPDVVVTIADRFETMSTAIAASYLGIPLAHIQGGEVTGSIDEKVRHAITKLADVHFPATKLAAERISKMGEHSSSIHMVGCPSIDIVAAVQIRDRLSFDPYDRYGGVGGYPNLEDGYVVAMLHPVTYEHGVAGIHARMLLACLKQVSIPTLWFWPNVDPGSEDVSSSLRKFREQTSDERFHFFKNMGPSDFIELLAHASCIVGNSSVAIRECEFLGVPAVNIGNRQRGRERGQNVVDVQFDEFEISQAVALQSQKERIPSVNLYGDGQSGRRIATVLAEKEFRVDKHFVI